MPDTQELTPLPDPAYPAGTEGMLGERAFCADQMRSYALSNMAPLQQRVAELEREIEGLRAQRDENLGSIASLSAECRYLERKVRKEPQP